MLKTDPAVQPANEMFYLCSAEDPWRQLLGTTAPCDHVRAVMLPVKHRCRWGPFIPGGLQREGEEGFSRPRTRRPLLIHPPLF